MRNASFLFRIMFVAFLAISSVSYAQKKIPGLTFRDTELATVSNKDIPAGKPLMIIYFRSDCDHCIHTAQQLKERVKLYPTEIWMVSAETIDALRTFEDMTGFYDVEHLTVLQDHTQSMHKWFDFSKLPYIVLFDKKGNQLKTFDELPTVATVKSLLSGK